MLIIALFKIGWNHWKASKFQFDKLHLSVLRNMKTLCLVENETYIKYEY